MAAMPSAVLMGMGLTPQLASAKPQPKNPFKDGPCVSAPDKEDEARADAAEKAKENSQRQAEEAEEAKEKAERKAEKRKDAAERAEKGKAEKEKAEKEKAGPTPEESPSGADGSDSAEDSGSPAEPEPEPSESESKNPLDPLGVGEKLKDLLTPGEKDEQEDDESATPTPEPSDPGTGGSDEPQSPGGDADKPGGDGKSGEDGTGEQDDGTDGADGSGPDEKPEPTPSESEAEKGQDEAEAGAGEDGKKPFPCVEEEKVDGEDEQTPVTLPNQPWELQASKLALHGLDYEGVVNVRTADGGSKQALKFTADSVDIGDLHQIVGGPNGTQYHVRAAEGSTSTIRDGQVTMYTERLEGNLFGIIPIVFDPEHPPPLNVPEAMFTEVKVQQAGQFGGTLTIPGLQQEITR